MSHLTLSSHQKNNLIALATDAAMTAFGAAFEAMDATEEAVRVSEENSESDILFLNNKREALKRALESVTHHLTRMQTELEHEMDVFDQKKFAALVHSMSVALTAVGDLTAFGEATANKQTLLDGTAHLPETIREVLGRLAPLFGDREIDFLSVFSPRPQLVRTNSHLLRNILINILLQVLRQEQGGNIAIKLSPSKKGTSEYATLVVHGASFQVVPGLEVPAALTLDGRIAYRIRKGFSYGMAIALEYMMLLGGEIELDFYDEGPVLKLTWPLV